MSKFFSKEAFSVLRFRDFKLFLAYRFFMTVAVLMQSVIVGWQLYEITKNPLSLGMIGLTEVIHKLASLCLPVILSIFGIGKKSYSAPVLFYY